MQALSIASFSVREVQQKLTEDPNIKYLTELGKASISEHRGMHYHCLDVDMLNCGSPGYTLSETRDVIRKSAAKIIAGIIREKTSCGDEIREEDIYFFLQRNRHINIDGCIMFRVEKRKAKKLAI